MTWRWPHRASHTPSAPSIAALSDQATLHRAGRVVAVQSAVALGLLLFVVGLAVYLVDTHVQQQQIATQLTVAAANTDDVSDPPPGMALALRGPSGPVAISANAPQPIASLITGPTGYSDLHVHDVHYRALVSDNPHGRVVALLDLQPFDTGRNRLLLALALAEGAGIAAAAAVVLLLSRRSIRPLTHALALQRRFVADASHELRAPLTVLHTRAQMLARRAHHKVPDELHQELQGLVADTRALGEVVEELLLAASLESGPQTHERVDLLALSQQVRASVAAHAQSLDIAVEVESSTDDRAEQASFLVDGSRSALRRALLSLVDNALAHERPGGRVLLHVNRDDATVRVHVVDTGVGIDPARAQTVFTRFAHGDTQPAGGRRYGIGLSLVREIAHAHHGEILVDTHPHQGATFTLRLPAAPITL